MAAKNLQPDEMIQISGTWLDPAAKSHQAIMSTPDLASSVPRLDAAHKAVAAADQPAANPRIAQIIDEEAKLDVRHDAIIRGIWGFLTAMAELIGGDPGTALISLRDLVLPDGLQSQLKTYRGEAGQAAQLAARMTPVVRAQTDAILVGQGPSAKTLSAHIDELIDLGQQLGALEDERGQLEAGPSQGGAMQKARLSWIRVVNAMVANGELAELDPDTDALIFGPLRAAEKKADERARQAAAAAKAKAKEAAEKATANKPGSGTTGTPPQTTTSQGSGTTTQGSGQTPTTTTATTTG